MKARSVFLLLCAALALVSHASSARAAGLCPSTKSDLEWSSRCFENTGAGRRVKPAQVKNIVVNKSGYAIILIDTPRELLVVDRRGVVTISNIYHTGDFDYPTARNNIGRFEVTLKNAVGQSTSKCGYFHTVKLKIVIPAIYDNCHAFNEGAAVACTDCTRYCTEAECQNSVFLGGQAFVIDRKNKILRKFEQYTLDSVCDSPELMILKERGGGGASKYLQCLPAPGSPFSSWR